MRFRDRTLDSICRTPLGELVEQVKKWKLAAEREEGGRRTGPRGRKPAHVPGRRRPQLPDARPGGADALRRRGAADSPGQPGRQRPVRRALRARRADDRPPPARQRPADHRAEEAPRPRQHAARRRARPRSGRQRRRTARLRPRRRPARRPDRRLRHAGASREAARQRHRAVSERQEGDPGADESKDAEAGRRKRE